MVSGLEEFETPGKAEPGGSDDVITVFLADDHVLVRGGFVSLISNSPDIRVIGQCDDGLMAIEQVIELRPDVAVLDISMRGLDVCRELSKKAKDTGLLILTMHDDEQFVVTALRNGASGYLTKEAAPKHFPAAIRSVANRQIYLSPGISRDVLDMVDRDETDRYETLSTRERQVLQMIVEGMTNREIAAKLTLSAKTIDTHRTRLMNKLDLHDQVSLVKFAIGRGIASVE